MCVRNQHNISHKHYNIIDMGYEHGIFPWLAWGGGGEQLGGGRWLASQNIILCLDGPCAVVRSCALLCAGFSVTPGLDRLGPVEGVGHYKHH